MNLHTKRLLVSWQGNRMGWPRPKNFPLLLQWDKRPYQMLDCMTERRQTGTEKVLQWHLPKFWTTFTVLIYASRWRGRRMKMIPISGAVNETRVLQWLHECPAWVITAPRVMSYSTQGDVFNILSKPWCPCQSPGLCTVLPSSSDLHLPCRVEEMAIPVENWRSNSPTDEACC